MSHLPRSAGEAAKRVILATTLLVGIASVSNATDEGSQQLIDNCRIFVHIHEMISPDYQAAAYCGGYLAGFADAGHLWAPKGAFCIPENALMGQVVAVYIKWADDHPEKWHRPRIITMLQAMHQRFPCSAQ